MEPQIASHILLSNAMFDAVGDAPRAGGVAVLGNKILAVGGKDEVMAYQGAETSVEDFGDRLLLPGFCDSHIHLLLGCLFACEADLSAAKSAEEAAQILKKHFDDNKDNYEDGEWVLGFSWYNLWWDDTALPTKEVLDKYFPDRPVFLMNADAHAVWVNSKALEIAGVDKNTPEVPYGEIFRDANGEPTGFLSEMAMSLCIQYAYALPEAKETRLLQNIMKRFSSLGITSVNDMQYFFGLNMGNVDVYEKLAKSGDLTFRINFASGLLNDLADTRALMERYGAAHKEDMVYHNGVKEFMDGIITTHTSIMVDHYSDDPEAPTEFALMDLAAAAKNIKILQKEGCNIHLHATGDGAVHRAIDMYEAAQKENGKTASRLSIEHLDLTQPADWERLGKEGIIASVQPPHITLYPSLEESDYIKVVGKRRSKFLWSFASMLKHGVTLAFGTDYPVVTINPMLGLHRAVTRLYPDNKPEGGWNPQEKLSLATALKAYTVGGAYKDGKEAVLGTLEPGKLADLVVLDRNLFQRPDSEILDCQVEMTMVDGRIVYKK